MLLRYRCSDRHKHSSVKLQYIFTRTFCDLQMLRYGRWQKDSPNFVCMPTWDFQFKSFLWWVSTWGVLKNLGLVYFLLQCTWSLLLLGEMIILRLHCLHIAMIKFVEESRSINYCLCAVLVSFIAMYSFLVHQLLCRTRLFVLKFSMPNDNHVDTHIIY